MFLGKCSDFLGLTNSKERFMSVIVTVVAGSIAILFDFQRSVGRLLKFCFQQSHSDIKIFLLLSNFV